MFGILGGIYVDYKKEIIEMLENIHSEKFMKFLYNMIISFKKTMGLLKKAGRLIPAFFVKKFNHVENTLFISVTQFKQQLNMFYRYCVSHKFWDKICFGF